MSDGEINVDSIDGEVLTTANIVGELYPQGEKGDKGDPGNDGFSPTVTTEKVGKTTTITITDAEGEHTATILDGADGQGSGDMRTEVYDVNQNGIVDDAEKVNGHTVAKDVPADAKFTDTTYTAGTGIDITGNVITNTQTSAEWGNITGTLSDQTDLKNALDDKADTSDIPTKVSDLTNDSGFIDKDVNNLTNYDTSTTVNTKISDADEVLIGGDSGIKAGHQLWVDTSDVTPYVNSEISNSYGTSQTKGYSQEYQNAHNVVVSATQPSTSEKVWFAHGKNLFDGLLEFGTFSNDGDKTPSGTNYRSANKTKVKANTTYTFSINGVSQKYAVYYYDSTGAFLSAEGLDSGTFTTPSNCKYVSFRCYNADFRNDFLTLKVQLEQGSSATAYEAYISPYIDVLETEFYSKEDTIIEIGGNSSAQYIKFGNGKLIQYGGYNCTATTSSSGGFQHYYSQEVKNLAVPFKDTNYRIMASIYSNNPTIINMIYVTADTTITFNANFISSSNNDQRTIHWVAIGEWK